MFQEAAAAPASVPGLGRPNSKIPSGGDDCGADGKRRRHDHCFAESGDIRCAHRGAVTLAFAGPVNASRSFTRKQLAALAIDLRNRCGCQVQLCQLLV